MVRTADGAQGEWPGLVPDAEGRVTLPDSAFVPGETNWVWLRAEAPAESEYAPAVRLMVDDTVDGSSDNQVELTTVSCIGNDRGSGPP